MTEVVVGEGRFFGAGERGPISRKQGLDRGEEVYSCRVGLGEDMVGGRGLLSDKWKDGGQIFCTERKE